MIEGDESQDELAKKVVKIAKSVITPEMAKNQFRHCAISMD